MITLQLHDKITLLKDKAIALEMTNKLYPNITFNRQYRPIRITGPLSLNELKLIIRLQPSIELRSRLTTRAYQRYRKTKNVNKDLQQILKKYPKKSITRLENKYPYNLQQPLKHYVVWCKGYTWKEIEDKKDLLYIKQAKLYWINAPKFRSITTIPHYHLIY